jgi:hypothetical protein
LGDCCKYFDFDGRRLDEGLRVKGPSVLQSSYLEFVVGGAADNELLKLLAVLCREPVRLGRRRMHLRFRLPDPRGLPRGRKLPVRGLQGGQRAGVLRPFRFGLLVQTIDDGKSLAAIAAILRSAHFVRRKRLVHVAKVLEQPAEARSLGAEMWDLRDNQLANGGTEQCP